MLVAVADVPRRRASLESLVAGLAPEGLAVASWGALARDPALAAGFDHLVALDPPPRGTADPLLGAAPLAHLAWGPAEAEFALSVWRAELDLRPALMDAYRALRALEAPERALAGTARYPRSPECCALLVQILGELALIEFDAAGPSLRVLDAARTDLERSDTFRACRERLAAIERALTPELGEAPPAAAASG